MSNNKVAATFHPAKGRAVCEECGKRIDGWLVAGQMVWMHVLPRTGVPVDSDHWAEPAPELPLPSW